MKWTVAPFDVKCGGCGATVFADQPLALYTTLELRRCQTCAGVPIDVDEIENERWRLTRERAATAARPASPVYRHQPRTFVKASDAVGDLFDPKMAAAGDREDP